MNICSVEKIDVVIENDSLEKAQSFAKTSVKVKVSIEDTSLKKCYINVPLNKGEKFFINLKNTNAKYEYISLYFIKNDIESSNTIKVYEGISELVATQDADKLMFTVKGEWYSADGIVEVDLYKEIV